MHITEVGLWLAASANLLLGLAVYSRGWRNPTNVIFLLLATMIAAWGAGVALFLQTRGSGNLIIFANLYYAAAIGIGIAIMLFTSFWLGENHRRGLAWVAAAGYAAVAGIFAAFPNLIIHYVALTQAGRAVALNNLGYLAYSIAFLGLFGYSIIRLYRYQRTVEPVRRLQTQYIIAALLSAGSLGVIFNLLLPWAGNYQLIWVGPVFSILFVAILCYAMARHQLFDFRRAAARAFTYLLLLVVLSAGYLVLVVGVGGHMLSGQRLQPVQNLILMIFTFAAAALFHPMKVRFDRLTNRFFYRDAYDSQDLFDQLNHALVSSTDIPYLMRRSTAILGSYLKPQFCRIDIRDGAELRLFGDRSAAGGPNSLSQLETAVTRLRREVTSVRDMPADKRHLFESLGIAVVVRLKLHGRGQGEELGYVLLGEKISGAAYSTQDMRALAAVAGELSIAIQNTLRFEQIERFNQTLQEKVAQATRQLQQSNYKLKALDETKDDFISMASHQMRTPLTAVKGYLSLVLEGDAGKITPMQSKLLTQAFDSSQRMVYLIADLLNVSRLKTGKFIIQTAPANLAEIVANEVEQLAATAVTHNLTITYRKPDHFPLADIDETKMRQVIMNFLDNAIYYTPSGGSITISLTEQSKTVEFRITDTGIGVPKAEQHHLFSKFYRAKNAQQARPDGTGLGLFMARKVVVAQGGAIIFSSTEGQGSTFGFTLPKRSDISTAI